MTKTILALLTILATALASGCGSDVQEPETASNRLNNFLVETELKHAYCYTNNYGRFQLVCIPKESKQ